MSRVLLVDDDTELCELVTEYLAQEGFEVEAVYEGNHGIERAADDDIQLVILDVMLPGASGFDVLRRIREHSGVPVIMLTARGEDVDRIVGLELGADDYLPKPFNPRELAARIRAVLRRAQRPGAGGEQVLTVGDVSLDPGSRTVNRGGTGIELTGTEFSLLEVLVRAAGEVVERDRLSREVLGRRASSLDRSLDVHISSLRRKLGPLPDGSERIKTVRSVGYLYVRRAESS